MPFWADTFRIFTLAFSRDPLSAQDDRDFTGSGTPQPDAMPDMRGLGAGSGSVQLRTTNEFVDLSTVTNRLHRYKEYERLRIMPEIEMAMTVIADEACLSGNTLISTPTYGQKPIKWFAENMKDERFLVYCWDFDKQDYTLGWAYAPRLTKEAETVRIIFNDGSSVICTLDHRILNADRQWIEAGDLTYGDSVLAFHHLEPRQSLTNNRTNQFPRIYSHQRGWIHERQFVDEWRNGKPREDLQEVNKIGRMICGGLRYKQLERAAGHDMKTLRKIVERVGWSYREFQWLGKKEQTRRVVGIIPNGTIPVYDLSVEGHANFCTDWGVVHNCQKDENGRVFQIVCDNQEIKEELEWLCFHRKMLNFDQKRMYNRVKNLLINGDDFLELCINPENPKEGIKKLVPLPADSMYRIETTKGRLVEFQQSKEGPDYESLARVEVTQATEADLAQCKAIRFAPQQIVHIRIGDDRKTFYPYGVSLIEAARGPAHQLRMMEDAMVVYRLTRAPERRVFYIDTMGLPGPKAEALIERMKDQFKKKKTAPTTFRGDNASAVEERWHAPSADEDYFVPIRPNTNTRIETLPGAQNLGEIDDTVYFRNKLFVALNFPRIYYNSEDPQTTSRSASAIDIKFARMIERIQSHVEDAIWEVCDRHLKLRGFPEEAYEDLEIKLTPPSDYKELMRTEVFASRIQNAGSLKGSQLMADYDILTKWMKYPEDEVKKMLARLKIQKLEDLKLQIIAQNPGLLGVGVPGPEEEQIGTEPGEDQPMLGGKPDENTPPPGAEEPNPEAPPPPQMNNKSISAIPEPSDEDIQRYNLNIRDYESEMDREEIDRSEM